MVALTNVEVDKKILISKFAVVLAAIAMYFSSYIAAFIPEEFFTDQNENIQDKGFDTIHWLMGTFINSYIINACIILAYVIIYRRLRSYYIQLNCNYDNLISHAERMQMDNTLSSLLVFFGCICQCFVYRIVQRVIIDLNPDVWAGDGKKSPLKTVILNLFYVSEMIMIMGICISINKTVSTAAAHETMEKQISQGVDASTKHLLATDDSILLKNDVVGGTGFIENEKRRSRHLNRLSMGGNLFMSAGSLNRESMDLERLD